MDLSERSRALAESARGLGEEMAQRIDDLKKEGHMNAHAAESMSGILEGLDSIRAAQVKLAKDLKEDVS